MEQATFLFVLGSVPSFIYGLALYFFRVHGFYRVWYVPLAITSLTGGILVTFAAIIKRRSRINANRLLFFALYVHFLTLFCSIFDMLVSLVMIGHRIWGGKDFERSENAILDYTVAIGLGFIGTLYTYKFVRRCMPYLIQEGYESMEDRLKDIVCGALCRLSRLAEIKKHPKMLEESNVTSAADRSLNKDDVETP